MTKKQRTYNVERTVFSINGVGKTGQPCLTPLTKTNLKWIKDLKLLEENVEKMFLDMGLRNDSWI